MKKQSIIYVAILAVVFAALYAGHRVFVAAQLKQFDEAQKFAQDLEAKAKVFQTTFGGVRPELVVERWQKAMDPWMQAALQRQDYFSMGDVLTVEAVPEGELPLFFYEDQYNKILTELTKELSSKQVALNWTGFGAPSPDQLGGQALTNDDVEYWLRLLKEGVDTVQLLVNAGAVQIYSVEIWPKRTEYGVLEAHTAGLAFMMQLEPLAKFINQLATDPKRYCNVNALRITNQNLVSPANPWLQVEMLITRTSFLPDGTPTTTAGSASSASGMSGMPGMPGMGGGSGMMGMMGGGMPGMPGMPGMQGPAGDTGVGAPRKDAQKKQESWWKKWWPF